MAPEKSHSQKRPRSEHEESKKVLRFKHLRITLRIAHKCLCQSIVRTTFATLCIGSFRRPRAEMGFEALDLFRMLPCFLRTPARQAHGTVPKFKVMFPARAPRCRRHHRYHSHHDGLAACGFLAIRGWLIDLCAGLAQAPCSARCYHAMRHLPNHEQDRRHASSLLSLRTCCDHGLGKLLGFN